MVAPGPAFLVLGPCGNVVLRTGAAGRYLEDLGADGAAGDDPLPFPVLACRPRLRLAGRRTRHPPLPAAGTRPLRELVRAARHAERAGCGRPLLDRDRDRAGRPARGRAAALPAVRPLAAGAGSADLGGPRRADQADRLAPRPLGAHGAGHYLDKACDKVGVRGTQGARGRSCSRTGSRRSCVREARVPGAGTLTFAGRLRLRRHRAGPDRALVRPDPGPACGPGELAAYAGLPGVAAAASGAMLGPPLVRSSGPGGDRAAFLRGAGIALVALLLFAPLYAA